MIDVKAPITGAVWRIPVRPDDEVKAGDVAVILESMKMEIPIELEVGGTVDEVLVSEGQAVEEGQVVVRLR